VEKFLPAQLHGVVVKQPLRLRYLSVTRDAVVLVAVSKLTYAPRRIVSTSPRDQVQVTVRPGGIRRTQLRLTNAAGAHRYKIPRWARRDLNAVLTQLGVPPVLKNHNGNSNENHAHHRLS
jgi:hypothetical protein